MAMSVCQMMGRSIGLQQTDTSSRVGCYFWLVLSVMFWEVNQDSWDPRFNKKTTVKMRHAEGIPDKRVPNKGRCACEILGEGVAWISVKVLQPRP